MMLFKNYLIFISAILVTLALCLHLNIEDGTKNISSFLEGAFLLKYVIVYLISLEILKTSLSSKKNLFNLNFDLNSLSKNQLRFISLLSAFPFGLGVSSFLQGISKTIVSTKYVSQGMTLSMLIYPTTLASGFVFDYYKINFLFSISIYGIPVILLFLFPYNKNLVFKKYGMLVLKIIMLAIINILYINFISFFFENNFLIKQSLFFIMLAFFLNKTILVKLFFIIKCLYRQILFFLAIGLFGSSLLEYQSVLFLKKDLLSSYSFLLPLLPIIFIPILSILFIHPLILFLIFNSFLDELFFYFNYTNLDMYFLWIIMLINSQLLSPVSLTTVISSKNTGTNIFAESFLKHYKFVFSLSVVSFLYITIIKNY